MALAGNQPVNRENKHLPKSDEPDSTLLKEWSTVAFFCFFVFSCASTQNATLKDTDTELSDSVTINVNLDQTIGDIYPMWAYWGYDEPKYTYMADGRKLIAELGKLSPGSVYYRVHSMLNTDEGPRAALKWGSTNAHTED